MNMVEIFFGIAERQAIAAGPSSPSASSRPRSAASSTPTTPDANPSPGPNPPTRSSRRL